MVVITGISLLLAVGAVNGFFVAGMYLVMITVLAFWSVRLIYFDKAGPRQQIIITGFFRFMQNANIIAAIFLSLVYGLKAIVAGKFIFENIDITDMGALLLWFWYAGEVVQHFGYKLFGAGVFKKPNDLAANLKRLWAGQPTYFKNPVGGTVGRELARVREQLPSTNFGELRVSFRRLGAALISMLLLSGWTVGLFPDAIITTLSVLGVGLLAWGINYLPRLYYAFRLWTGTKPRLDPARINVQLQDLIADIRRRGGLPDDLEIPTFYVLPNRDSQIQRLRGIRLGYAHHGKIGLHPKFLSLPLAVQRAVLIHELYEVRFGNHWQATWHEYSSYFRRAPSLNDVEKAASPVRISKGKAWIPNGFIQAQLSLQPEDVLKAIQEYEILPAQQGITGAVVAGPYFIKAAFPRRALLAAVAERVLRQINVNAPRGVLLYAEDSVLHDLLTQYLDPSMLPQGEPGFVYVQEKLPETVISADTNMQRVIAGSPGVRLKGTRWEIEGDVLRQIGRIMASEVMLGHTDLFINPNFGNLMITQDGGQIYKIDTDSYFGGTLGELRPEGIIPVISRIYQAVFRSITDISGLAYVMGLVKMGWSLLIRGQVMSMQDVFVWLEKNKQMERISRGDVSDLAEQAFSGKLLEKTEMYFQDAGLLDRPFTKYESQVIQLQILQSLEMFLDLDVNQVTDEFSRQYGSAIFPGGVSVAAILEDLEHKFQESKKNVAKVLAQHAAEEATIALEVAPSISAGKVPRVKFNGSGIVGAAHTGHRELYLEMKARFGAVVDYFGWGRVLQRLEAAQTQADREAVRTALQSLLAAGLTQEQIDRMADRILLVSVKESRLDKAGSTLGGLILRHDGQFKVAFPRHRLTAAPVALGDLLHEMIEIELMENGLRSNEAHWQAVQVQQTFEQQGVLAAAAIIRTLRDPQRLAQLIRQLNDIPQDEEGMAPDSLAGVVGASTSDRGTTPLSARGAVEWTEQEIQRWAKQYQGSKRRDWNSLQSAPERVRRHVFMLCASAKPEQAVADFAKFRLDEYKPNQRVERYQTAQVNILEEAFGVIYGMPFQPVQDRLSTFSQLSQPMAGFEGGYYYLGQINQALKQDGTPEALLRALQSKGNPLDSPVLRKFISELQVGDLQKQQNEILAVVFTAVVYQMSQEIQAVYQAFSQGVHAWKGQLPVTLSNAWLKTALLSQTYTPERMLFIPGGVAPSTKNSSFQPLHLPGSAAIMALAGGLAVVAFSIPVLNIFVGGFFLWSLVKTGWVLIQLAKQHGVRMFAHLGDPVGAYNPQLGAMVNPAKPNEVISEVPLLVRAHDQYAHRWTQTIVDWILSAFGKSLATYAQAAQTAQAAGKRAPLGYTIWNGLVSEVLAHGMDMFAASIIWAKDVFNVNRLRKFFNLNFLRLPMIVTFLLLIISPAVLAHPNTGEFLPAAGHEKTRILEKTGEIQEFIREKAGFQPTEFIRQKFSEGVQVITLGEIHYDRASKAQAVNIIENTPVTHLVIELNESARPALDHYIQTGEAMPLKQAIFRHYKSICDVDGLAEVISAGVKKGIPIIFPDPRGDGGNYRVVPNWDITDEVMAGKVADIVKQNSQAKILVYMGINHSGLKVRPDGKPNMGSLLRNREDFKSLTVVFSTLNKSAFGYFMNPIKTAVEDSSLARQAFVLTKEALDSYPNPMEIRELKTEADAHIFLPDQGAKIFNSEEAVAQGKASTPGRLHVSPLRMLLAGLGALVVGMILTSFGSPDLILNPALGWGIFSGLGLVLNYFPRLFYVFRLFAGKNMFLDPSMAEEQIESVLSEVERISKLPVGYTRPAIGVLSPSVSWKQFWKGILIGQADRRKGRIELDARFLNLPRVVQVAVLKHELYELNYSSHWRATLAEYGTYFSLPALGDNGLRALLLRFRRIEPVAAQPVRVTLDAAAAELRLYPQALLHSPDLAAHLDAFDREHFEFVETDAQTHLGYWRSRDFGRQDRREPELILGSWQDLEKGLPHNHQKMKTHVVERFRRPDGKIVSFYYYDDHAYAVPYAQEAVARGELPASGNTQLFLDEHFDFEGKVTDASFPREIESLGKPHSLYEWFQGVKKYIFMNNLNWILASAGLIKRHIWVFDSRSRYFESQGLSGEAQVTEKQVHAHVLQHIKVGLDKYFAYAGRPQHQDAYINVDSDVVGDRLGVGDEHYPARMDARTALRLLADFCLRLSLEDHVLPSTFQASTTADITTYGDVEIVKFLARVAPVLMLGSGKWNQQDLEHMIAEAVAGHEQHVQVNPEKEAPVAGETRTWDTVQLQSAVSGKSIPVKVVDVMQEGAAVVAVQDSVMNVMRDKVAAWLAGVQRNLTQLRQAGMEIAVFPERYLATQNPEEFERALGELQTQADRDKINIIMGTRLLLGDTPVDGILVIRPGVGPVILRDLLTGNIFRESGKLVGFDSKPEVQEQLKAYPGIQRALDGGLTVLQNIVEMELGGRPVRVHATLCADARQAKSFQGMPGDIDLSVNVASMRSADVDLYIRNIRQGVSANTWVLVVNTGRASDVYGGNTTLSPRGDADVTHRLDTASYEHGALVFALGDQKTQIRKEAVQRELERLRNLLPEGVNEPVKGLRFWPLRLLQNGLQIVLFGNEVQTLANMRGLVKGLAVVVLVGVSLLAGAVTVFADSVVSVKVSDDNPRLEAMKSLLVVPDATAAKEYGIKGLRFCGLSEQGGLLKRIFKGMLFGAYTEGSQSTADQGAWATVYVPDVLLAAVSNPAPVVDGTIQASLARLNYQVKAFLFGVIAGQQANKHYAGIREQQYQADVETNAAEVKNLQGGISHDEWLKQNLGKVGVNGAEVLELAAGYLQEVESELKQGADVSLESLNGVLSKQVDQGADARLQEMRSGLESAAVKTGSVAELVKQVAQESGQFVGTKQTVVGAGLLKLMSGQNVAGSAQRGVESAGLQVGQEVNVMGMKSYAHIKNRVSAARSELEKQGKAAGLIARLRLLESVLEAGARVNAGESSPLSAEIGAALLGEVNHQARTTVAGVREMAKDLTENTHAVVTGKVATEKVGDVAYARSVVYEVVAPSKQKLTLEALQGTTLPKGVQAA